VPVLIAQAGGGHHRGIGAVVKAPQVADDRRAQPANAVVVAVSMEVGAEVRHHRQLQAPCRAYGRPAERAFGGHVHHVRPAARPQPRQRPRARQTHAQVRITRNRHTRHHHLFEARHLRRQVVEMLAQPHQLDIVAAIAQAREHARQRVRHAVHLGRIGLGDHRHLQPCPAGRSFDVCHRPTSVVVSARCCRAQITAR
jgi:hypothetical protein